MKDEIKEINIPENVLVALSDLTNGVLNYYKSTEAVKVRHNTILDYITNLQEKLDYMIDRNDEKQERIDKAIECIKTPIVYETNNIEDLEKSNATRNQELLSILKGEDE